MAASALPIPPTRPPLMMMPKLLHTILFFILVTFACGQNVVISYPPPGTKVKPGKHLRVQIARPDTLSSSLEIGVGIAIASCATHPCFPPQDFMGDILYHGAYKPVQLKSSLTLFQNFSVEIPSGFPKGHAQLNVAHSALIGAGSIPYLQTLNISLVVE